MVLILAPVPATTGLMTSAASRYSGATSSTAPGDGHTGHRPAGHRLGDTADDHEFGLGHAATDPRPCHPDEIV